MMEPEATKEWFIAKYGAVEIKVNQHVTCSWSQSGVDFHANGNSIITFKSRYKIGQLIELLRSPA